MAFIVGLIDAAFWIIAGFLILRFSLRLLAANPGTPFVRFVYDSSTPILAPFAGIFPSPVIERGHIVEFSTLFAIIAYSLMMYLILELIAWLARVARP